MNAIDIIEAAKIKEGISDKTLTDRTEIVSQSSYSQYRSRSVEPSHTAIVQLLNAVGKRLFVISDNMKGDANIAQWAILDMWIRCNKEETWHLFNRSTKLNVTQNEKIFRDILLYTWFYKTHKSLPTSLFYSEEVKELETWGLLTMSKIPSETAYEFYNTVVMVLNDYLTHANLIQEITE